MKFSAKQIAQLLGGSVDGDENVEVFNLSKIEEGKEGTLSFLSNPKYTNYIYETNASLVIVSNDFLPDRSVKPTLIRVSDPYSAFTQLLEAYNQMKNYKSGIENPVFISNSSEIGENPYIGAFAYIGERVRIGKNVKIYPHAYIGDNVQIGDNTIIFPGTKVYSDCVIGQNCTIHASCVIGSDGFGFSPQADGTYKKIPQIGNVIIGNNVEIGAGSCIDRATMGSTVIGEGVKMDNLIQIAHNVVIGDNTVIAAQTGIAGSTKVGKECVIGGQVGFAGHLIIADKVKIQAQSGIASNINNEGEIVQGSPAMPIMDFKRSYVYFRKFPDLIKRMDDIEGKE